jgi:hypothetical protein
LRFRKLFSKVFNNGFRASGKELTIEFVTPSHSPEILEKNLLKSIIFEKYKLTVQSNYPNISKAYNEAKTDADIVIYVHHDVYMPPSFEKSLLASLRRIEKIDPNWGVLGIAGTVITKKGKYIYGHLLDRGNRLGNPKELPREVETLDEVMLITRGDIKFDEDIPSVHFYGADICLQARLQGRKSYAIEAYCHHNTARIPGVVHQDDGYLIAREYIRKKYEHLLPIPTTTTIIS